METLQRMETLLNCFQTTFKPFRETITGPVWFQNLPTTATIHTLPAITGSKLSIETLELSIETLNHPKVLLSPERKIHFLIQNSSLILVAWLDQEKSSKGISERAIDLISNARRTGSQSNYESAWRKWGSWCHRK